MQIPISWTGYPQECPTMRTVTCVFISERILMSLTHYKEASLGPAERQRRGLIPQERLRIECVWLPSPMKDIQRLAVASAARQSPACVRETSLKLRNDVDTENDPAQVSTSLWCLVALRHNVLSAYSMRRWHPAPSLMTAAKVQTLIPRLRP